ncbi:hypothetical protein RhiJN_26670 [Ceratobasidium sp. AG-Ba]|nr:hypothetical protein RhiJN_12619 [Ceratobasidium sp. AG-Ba]QRV98651.1 hypothetical protein RhiJN_26670 [Ceratobasidium sp. AG-Ba]
MSQARGTADGTPQGGVVVKVRSPDGEIVLGNGRLNPTTPGWESMNVTVDYTDFNELVGQHSFKGYIGQTDFLLEFLNGVKCHGPLQVPQDKRTTVQGSLTWDVSY